MKLLQLIFGILLIAAHAECLFLNKRLYQPTSPVFSLIALHNGTNLKSNLVKFNGTDLILDKDDSAFFGRIKANNGYVLNIPFANGTNSTVPSTRNVYVDKNNLLSSKQGGNNATGEFGIASSLLTYRNSTRFLACSGASNGTYTLYAQSGNTTCPGKHSKKYDIHLLVQVSAYINYNPLTNVLGPFKKQ